jgi:hypothetical protein
MNRSIRAHFDGKVFIPDEPVDAPINQPLRLRIDSAASTNGLPTPAEQRRMLAHITGIISGGPAIDPEALRRENLYDDRA